MVLQASQQLVCRFQVFSFEFHYSGVNNDSSAIFVKVRDSMDAWGLLSLQPPVHITEEALRATAAW